MTEMDCRQVEESATEYALGILPRDEAAAVSAHLLVCPACRAEVEAIGQVGDRLLDLVPDAEPPVGFEDRVMSAVGAGRPPRRARRRPVAWRGRSRLILGAAAAAAVLAGAGVAATTLTGGHHPSTSTDLAGVLRQGGREVGTVYVGGHPAWVSMTVQQLPVNGSISCQLVTRDGKVTTVGTFEVLNGRGSWGAPEPAGLPQPTEARLISPTGAVVAQGPLSAD